MQSPPSSQAPVSMLTSRVDPPQSQKEPPSLPRELFPDFEMEDPNEDPEAEAALLSIDKSNKDTVASLPFQLDPANEVIIPDEEVCMCSATSSPLFQMPKGSGI